jgi:hypothetical protein
LGLQNPKLRKTHLSRRHILEVETMRTLRNPSQGVDVYFLQRLLNKAAARNPGRISRVAEDGRFGRLTQTAVREFQALPHNPRLVVDGTVGRETWWALGQTVEIDHRVTLIAQGTNWSCWQAAASMVSEATGRALSVATSETHLAYYFSSGMNGIDATHQLGRELGWRELRYSPPLQELIAIMRRTPIYVGGNLTATNSAHAVAFGGLYSDGSPEGTVIRVYNPSPVGSGLIHQLFYNSMVSPLSGSPFVPRSFLIPP